MDKINEALKHFRSIAIKMRILAENQRRVGGAQILTYRELLCLQAIKDWPAIKLHQLATIVGGAPSSISHTIDQLVKEPHGYLERESGPERSFILTPKGERMVEDYQADLEKTCAEILSGIPGPVDWDVVTEYLGKFTDAVNRVFEKRVFPVKYAKRMATETSSKPTQKPRRTRKGSMTLTNS